MQTVDVIGPPAATPASINWPVKTNLPIEPKILKEILTVEQHRSQVRFSPTLPSQRASRFALSGTSRKFHPREVSRL